MADAPHSDHGPIEFDCPHCGGKIEAYRTGFDSTALENLWCETCQATTPHRIAFLVAKLVPESRPICEKCGCESVLHGSESEE